jgi:Asp-tRNA(Asn)/Glu-tRNA(Gln) amidotransferase B subunit
MQLVEIVEKHVRFHLSQDKTNQFIVTTVSKTTNQQEMTVAEADLADVAVADMVETVVVEDLEETEMADAVPEDMAETAAVVEDLEETDLHERCTQLHVQNVEQNVKFHSNQTEKSQFIVTTASKTRNQQETTAEDISHFYTNNPFKNY